MEGYVFLRTRPVTTTSIFGPTILTSRSGRLTRWKPFIYWLVIFLSISLTNKSKFFVTIIIIPEKNITTIFIYWKIIGLNVPVLYDINYIRKSWNTLTLNTVFSITRVIWFTSIPMCVINWWKIIPFEWAIETVLP